MTHFMGFPGGSAGKESACNVGVLGSIPGLGRSPGKGNSYSLQYSGLENSMDSRVHGVTKSQAQLSNFDLRGFPGSSVGKESACNVGVLGSIPGLGRSSWRRERLPTPVFWPGKFHGLYNPWGHKELDMTEHHVICKKITNLIFCNYYYFYYIF